MYEHPERVWQCFEFMHLTLNKTLLPQLTLWTGGKGKVICGHDSLLLCQNQIDQSGTSLLPLSRRSLFSVFSHVLTLDWDLCPAYNILCLFRRIRSWAKKALEACGWKWREKSNLEGYCMSSSVLLQDRFISRIHKYIIFTFWIIVTEMFKFALLRVSKKKFKRISRTSISYKRVVGYSISSKKALSVQFKIPLVGHIM